MGFGAQTQGPWIWKMEDKDESTEIKVGTIKKLFNFLHGPLIKITSNNM